jgi:AraC-like DNA-binding protein
LLSSRRQTEPELRAKPDIKRRILSGANVVHCLQPAWREPTYVSHSSAGSIGLSFTSQHCVVSLDGRTAERIVGIDSVVLSGIAPPTWLRVAADSEVIEISAGPALRRSIADELCAEAYADLDDAALASDAVIWSIAAQFRAAIRGTLTIEDLEADCLVRMAYRRVFLTHFGGRLRERGGGALDCVRLRRVTEYIDAHLQDKLTLDALADVAALSPYHFQRSFRRATGCSPHNYVAFRRGDRARLMLARGAFEIEVAARTGFATARSLRSALRRQG